MSCHWIYGKGSFHSGNDHWTSHYAWARIYVVPNGTAAHFTARKGQKPHNGTLFVLPSFSKPEASRMKQLAIDRAQQPRRRGQPRRRPGAPAHQMELCEMCDYLGRRCV